MGKLNKKIYTQKTMDFKTGILVMLVGIAMLGITMSSVSAFVPGVATKINGYCDDPHGCYSSPYPKTCNKLIGWDFTAECEVNAYDERIYTEISAYASYYVQFPLWMTSTKDKILGLPKKACEASAWARATLMNGNVKTSITEC